MNALRIVTVANPAAGANFTYMHPGNVVSLVRCLRLSYQHDANAGNRYIVLSLFEPGGLLMSSVRFTVPVTVVDPLNYFCLQSQRDAVQSGYFFGVRYLNQTECPFFPVLPGWQLRSQVQGIFAGDQISDVRILFDDIGLESPGSVA